MRTHRLFVLLCTLPLLAAPASAAADCITAGTIQVSLPAGVTAQLWVQNANGSFNIVDVNGSSVWVTTPDGALSTTLLMINSTGDPVEPAVSIRQFSGKEIVGGTVPIAAGATFILGINECAG